MFKNDWEKTDKLVTIDPNIIKQMVTQFLPAKELISYQIISGGCANLNIKINLDDKRNYILRIYIRDQESAHHEQKIATLLKDSIPIPEIYYIGQVENYQFAIVEYIEGITLRDLLLALPCENIEHIMRETGSILAKIHKYQFPEAGFFDQNLMIKQKISKQEYIEFTKGCLVNPIAMSVISKEKISKINDILDKYSDILPDENEHNLVHGDYDPSNILVNKKNDQWEISAILDWEFAFSGSSLADVANMLRYAHQLPSVFQDSFIKGLIDGGMVLQDKWQVVINISNITSLLDLLARSPLEKHPKNLRI